MLRRPWLQAERIIADALGVPPEQIWPSRYTRDRSLSLTRGRYKLSELDGSTPKRQRVIHDKRVA